MKLKISFKYRNINSFFFYSNNIRNDICNDIKFFYHSNNKLSSIEYKDFNCLNSFGFFSTSNLWKNHFFFNLYEKNMYLRIHAIHINKDYYTIVLINNISKKEKRDFINLLKNQKSKHFLYKQYNELLNSNKIDSYISSLEMELVHKHSWSKPDGSFYIKSSRICSEGLLFDDSSLLIFQEHISDIINKGSAVFSFYSIELNKKPEDLFKIGDIVEIRYFFNIKKHYYVIFLYILLFFHYLVLWY